MASSDPPFDAADLPTTHPLYSERSSVDDAMLEPPATIPPRTNSNWFDPGFDADHVPTTAVTQPIEPQVPSTEAPASAGRAAYPQLAVSPVDLPPVEPEPATEVAAEPSAGALVEENDTAVDLQTVGQESGEPTTEPEPIEPTPMDSIAAEIAAALAALEPTPLRYESTPERRESRAVDFRQAPAPVTVPMLAPARASTAVSAPVPAAPASPATSRFTDIVTRAGKVAALVFAGWFCAVVVLIVLYRFINPPFSSLMAMQWLGGTQIRQDWVPLEEISPNLVHAVVVSEDGRFCEHWGIDFVEIAYALRHTPFGPPRGASTITMQVAKNLFLWPAKSYLRKLIEVPLTYAIELFWPKRRILEVYLNIAEWGPGIFGAEAASEAHFGRSASQLTPRQAAQLAVALPNPIIRDAGSPGPRTAHRASVIQRRTGHEPEAVACVMPGG